MTEGCTCCRQHATSAYRSSDPTPAISPPQIAETPELMKANAKRDKASAATRRACETWNKAAGAEAEFRGRLWAAYRWRERGIAEASRAEKKDLEILTRAAEELFEKYQEAGRLEVEARNQAAAAQHRATQQTIAEWAQEAPA